MITEQKPKRFLPYFLLGILFFLLGYAFTQLYLQAPASDPLKDPFAFSKVEWVFLHYGDDWSLFFRPHSISLIVGVLSFCAALFLYLYLSDVGVYRRGEEHGSARFTTSAELAAFQDKKAENNKLFTQHSSMGLFNKNLDFKHQINKNTLVIGGTGDWKTRSYVKPNLLQGNASFITTDTKGLIIHEVGHSLEEQGYKMKIFDLITFKNSNRFNPYHYMKDEMDIDRVAEAIVTATKKSDNQGEDFWLQAQLLLMRALIGYVFFDSQISQYTATLPQVADMIRHVRRQVPEVESAVELLFQDLEKDLPGNYACKQWDLFNKNFDGQTRTSVFATVANVLSVFDHEDVRNLLEEDSMEIEKWNLEKTAVFVHIPEVNPAYQFLSSLFFSTVFDVTIKTADSMILGTHPIASKKDLLHIQVMGDEFAQIGKIPNIAPIISVIRSREISLNMMIQSKSQLVALYGRENTDTLINNCGTILYLGTNDSDTLKYLSERSGKQTINDENRSENRGRNGSTTKQHSKLGRELMTPHEIATIGTTEALLFMAKQNVFRDEKYDLMTHPRASLLADDPEDATWYRYRRYMSVMEEWKERTRGKQVTEVKETDLKELPMSS